MAFILIKGGSRRSKRIFKLQRTIDDATALEILVQTLLVLDKKEGVASKEERNTK